MAHDVSGPVQVQLARFLRVAVVLTCRFDMFNVQLHRVKFDASERSYFLQGLINNKPEQKKRYTYRYL